VTDRVTKATGGKGSGGDGRKTGAYCKKHTHMRADRERNSEIIRL